MIGYFEAIILGIIEGLTEFLPVSSTAHLIIGEYLLKIPSSNFLNFLTIFIQLGAILAVLALYWKRFFQSLDFYFKLLVAFIPAVILGLIFNDIIDEFLESPLIVAFLLIIGGFVLRIGDKQYNASVANKLQQLKREFTY